MITSAQIRAARALLRWSARDLGEKSGVSLNTIQRMEATNGIPGGLAKNLAGVQRALEDAGVVFLAEEGALGPGVRLRRPD